MKNLIRRILQSILMLGITASFALGQTAGGGSAAPKKPVAKPKPKAAVPAPSIPRLPSATDIFARYLEAIGGRAANTKFKTRYQSGTVELSLNGIKGTVETFEAADAKSFLKLSLDGIGETLEGFDGTNGWIVSSIQGSRMKTGDELLQAKKSAFFYRDAYPERIYSKMTVKGTDSVDGRPVYVVVASATGLPDDIFYFDKETGLLLRSDSTSVSPEGRMAIQTYFSDYRETDGIKTPWKVKGVSPLFEITTTLTSVRNGIPIDDSKFTMPQ